MKAYFRSGSIAPHILDLGTRWRSASRPVRFTPSETAPRTPSYRMLGGRQSRSGHCGEEKNSQPLPGLKPSIRAIPLSYPSPLYENF